MWGAAGVPDGAGGRWMLGPVGDEDENAVLGHRVCARAFHAFFF